MAEKYQDPPEHLSEESQEIYRANVGTRLTTPAQKQLLVNALEAKDEADEYRAIIKAEGDFSTNQRSGLRSAHPAIRIRASKMELHHKIFKTLGLHEGETTYPNIETIIQQETKR